MDLASSTIKNVEALLAPISAEHPAGSDIRNDKSTTSPYQIIKAARNMARAAERNNMFDGVRNEADQHWRKILECAPDILMFHSKDLEIACWYTEALVRIHGFQGLRDGFTLIRELISQYWESLFPLPDEDGLETRTACLSGLNGEGNDGVLISPICSAFITEDISPGPFNFWQYQQALEFEKIVDEDTRAKKISKNGFSIEDIERTVNESSETFFINIRDNLSASIDEYQEISRLLEMHCAPQDAPPTSNIINSLTGCLGAICHLGKYKLPIENNPESVESNEKSTENINTLATATAKNSTLSRELAFKQLLEISEFFRTTEPHSPVSYMLEKAVKWGNLPLHELILELIPDSTSREHYGSLTGVKTNDEH